MSRVPVPADAQEIPYEAFARVASPTAASAYNRLFGKSGAIRYRVTVGMPGGALNGAVVTAETGDEAAEAALVKFPGWKVINVTPAGDEYRATDDLAAEVSA